MKFGLISSQDEYNKLMEFAKSFPDGKHGKGNLELPIVTMFNNQGLCGYFTQIRHPINMPAWHPELVTHREFVESVRALTASQQLASISDQFPHGVSYVGLELDNSMNDKMNALGYEDTNIKLWRAI